MLDSSVEMLGPVTACAGGLCCGEEEGCQWPLALTNPPEAYTYQAALRAKAVQQYGIPATEIVLGDIAVETENELVGTVRGWRATAQAGHRRLGGAERKDRRGDRTERLRELEQLREAGLLRPDEYARKRAAILDEL